METEGSEVNLQMEKRKNEFEIERRGLIEKYEKEIKRLNEIIEKNEDNEREIEKKYKILFNDSEKQRQSLEIDNKNLSSEIERLRKRISDIEKESKAQIDERNDTLIKIKANYESEIKELNEKYDKLSSKQIDLESSIKSYEHLIEFDKMEKEELKTKAKEDKESYEKKINEIKSKYNEDKKKLQSQIDNKENVIQDLLIKVQDVQKESMLFLKNAEEKMNQKSAEYQTLYFQEQQKNSFLEEKNKDLNEQLLQLKNNNEKIMDYIKNNNHISKEDIKDDTFVSKVSNLHKIFINEKKSLEQSFDEQKECFIREAEDKMNSISLLQQDIKNIEMKLSLTERELVKIQKRNKELEEQLLNTENIREHFNEELMKRNQVSKKEYEVLLAEKEKEHQKEIQELNSNSENTVKQLKEIFAEEKKRLESKIESSRDEYTKSIAQITSEYEEKLRDIDKNIKGDYDQLQIEYEDLKAKYNTLSIDAEHNISLLNQELMTSEQIIEQNKENILKITKAHNEDIQEKLRTFAQERKELNDKIDVLSKDNTSKDKTISDLNIEIEKNKEAINEKNNEINNIKKEYDNTIETIVKKFELYKIKQTEIANDFNIKKLDFIRESNLLKQQIDFLNKKIENQAAFSEENEQAHDENIFELKKDLEDTFNLKMNEVLNEKKELIYRLKEYEKLIKSTENKIEEVTNYYEDKLNQEKYNHEISCDKLRKQIKILKVENDKLAKEATEPIQKINTLLEIQTSLQKENNEMKDYIFDLETTQKTNSKQIASLKKENLELIAQNEKLNSSIYQLRMHLKIKNQNSSIELRKRHNSLFSKQSPLMVMSVSNLDNKMNNSEICNLSVTDSVFYNDLNSSGYVRKKIKNSTNSSLPNVARTEERRKKK